MKIAQVLQPVGKQRFFGLICSSDEFRQWFEPNVALGLYLGKIGLKAGLLGNQGLLGGGVLVTRNNAVKHGVQKPGEFGLNRCESFLLLGNSRR